MNDQSDIDKIERCLKDPRLVSIRVECRLKNGVLIIEINKIRKYKLSIADDLFLVRQVLLDRLDNATEISNAGYSYGKLMNLINKVKLSYVQASFINLELLEED